jgi:hypothetical protein
MSVCLIKYHAMKTYRRVEVHIHVFLTSAIGRNEQFHAPAALPPILSGYEGGWMGSITGLDTVTRKISCTCRESNDSLAIYPVTILQQQYSRVITLLIPKRSNPKQRSGR